MTQATPLAARPTTYKGVKMRSRLEARYAAWLDKVGFDWKYEPRAFASEEGQYLPDFQTTVLFAGRERLTFIEIKPTWERAREPYVEHISSIVHASEPEALIVVEVSEADHPMVWLPPSFNVPWSIDCHWVATDTQPYLGFLAAQEWREEYA